MRYYSKLAYKNNCFKAHKKLVPKGIMLHSVGVNQPSGEIIASRWNEPLPDGKEVCCHGVVDAESFYQTLPFDIQGWHGGGKVNNTHIGIEMTEPCEIRYIKGAEFEILDKEAVRNHVLQTYINAVLIFADLCYEYNLEPEKEGVIISHSEGYKRNIASNHADVEHLWNLFGLSMDMFRKDVKNEVDKKRLSDLSITDNALTLLEKNGIVTNRELWLDKAKTDVNVYWLIRKTAQWIANEMRGQNL